MSVIFTVILRVPIMVLDVQFCTDKIFVNKS